jgi:methionine-S-sulfoxide reductase
VGYAGGKAERPKYSQMGDHTETVQVDYDPRQITYSQLLEIFWKSHQPTGRSWSRQYMNAIFYHDMHQQQMAIESKAALEQIMGRTVNTEVLPLRTFTMAEDYHQKYILKSHNDLKNEMSRIYPLHRDFVNSTATARLNGYAGRNGSREQLTREIDRLGLSVEGKAVLTGMVDR